MPWILNLAKKWRCSILASSVGTSISLGARMARRLPGWPLADELRWLPWDSTIPWRLLLAPSGSALVCTRRHPEAPIRCQWRWRRCWWPCWWTRPWSGCCGRG